MTTVFLYARKSTDVDDKQVLSIDAQLSELREFATRERLTIIEELIEKQSAKTPGRPVFNSMLERLETGEADGILAWHPDRLARNSIDGGRIIYLLDTEKIKTLKFPRTWFENTPQGKLMLHYEFGFSKYYVDSLSENTKRGLREKVRRGEFPSTAPTGYLNDYRTKRLIVDPQTAPLVKQAFELYALGNSTLDDLRSYFAKHGVRTRNGKILGRATVSRIISNPIYYGYFKYNGEVHEGVHTPIISKHVFDEVHAVLNRRWRYSPQEKQTQPKAFVGLLRCAECGAAITAEIQKGHTYYRCTKKNKLAKCSQPYIREEALDVEISALISPYSLRADWADLMLAQLETERKESARSSAVLAAQKRAEIDRIKQRLQMLLDSLLDGIVERDTYITEKAKLMSQRRSLEEQAKALQQGHAVWLEPFKEWILTAKHAGQIAIEGSLDSKRGLAKKVFGSNLVLDCKKASGCAEKPWSLLLENSSSIRWVPGEGFEPSR
jgi:site-specific DNA recombinase